MAARNLICIAFAFKEMAKKVIPRRQKAILDWILPCEDLVLLAIFGIKVSLFLPIFQLLSKIILLLIIIYLCKSSRIHVSKVMMKYRYVDISFSVYIFVPFY